MKKTQIDRCAALALSDVISMTEIKVLLAFVDHNNITAKINLSRYSVSISFFSGAWTW